MLASLILLTALLGLLLAAKAVQNEWHGMACMEDNFDISFACKGDTYVLCFLLSVMSLIMKLTAILTGFLSMGLLCILIIGGF